MKGKGMKHGIQEDFRGHTEEHQKGVCLNDRSALASFFQFHHYILSLKEKL